jgi:pimeloyl-ACP methyl ester carboxylesterase
VLHEVRRRGLAAAVRKIRSARVIANAGHMTMMEAAKAVNDSIQELAAPLA